jgi:hypothetical protein
MRFLFVCVGGTLLLAALSVTAPSVAAATFGSHAMFEFGVEGRHVAESPSGGRPLHLPGVCPALPPETFSGEPLSCLPMVIVL